MDPIAPPPSRPSMPSVHFLNFSEERTSPSIIDRPDRDYQALWHMNVGKPPIRTPSSSSSSSSPDAPWRGIFEGDLVVFPPASDDEIRPTTVFESVRFAGREFANLVHRDGESWHEVLVPLMTSGIDRPEFPSTIATMAEHRGSSLREMYERPFEVATAAMLSGHEGDGDGGTMLMRASFANDVASYEGYWSNPPIARRRRPPTDDDGTWKFSLGDCVWLATVEEGNVYYGDPPSWAGKWEVAHEKEL